LSVERQCLDIQAPTRRDAFGSQQVGQAGTISSVAGAAALTGVPA